jgi:hypothetical protein
MVFESWLLREMVEPKNEEIRNWIKLHENDVHDLYF